MDAQLARVPESSNLLQLPSGVLGLAIPDVPFPRTDLPVGAELDASGWVQIVVEYVNYIEQPQEGEAGRLRAAEGERSRRSGED